MQGAGGSLETGVASRLTLGRQEEQLDEQTRRFREQVGLDILCFLWLAGLLACLLAGQLVEGWLDASLRFAAHNCLTHVAAVVTGVRVASLLMSHELCACNSWLCH